MKKFDAVVSNPPYSKKPVGGNPRRLFSIYSYFYELAENIGLRYCIISPARFLFNAGDTPKNWNRKMLSHKNVKVEYYTQNSREVFREVSITSGVTIIYYNKGKDFGEIGLFTKHKTLTDIVEKVVPLSNGSLMDIVSKEIPYKTTMAFHSEYPNAPVVDTTGRRRFESPILTRFYNLVVFKDKPLDGDNYVEVIGRHKGKQVGYWIKDKYVQKAYNHDTYRVFLPRAGGSVGFFGSSLSQLIVGRPGMAFTDSFLSIGSFCSRVEAENTIKYIKTKFARTMLGILKVTQSSTSGTWKYVPLQNFTENSDIDWSKPISDIDRQLYKKYGLDEHEINFIETRVKEMI